MLFLLTARSESFNFQSYTTRVLLKCVTEKNFANIKHFLKTLRKNKKSNYEEKENLHKKGKPLKKIKI